MIIIIMPPDDVTDQGDPHRPPKGEIQKGGSDHEMTSRSLSSILKVASTFIFHFWDPPVEDGGMPWPCSPYPKP